MAHVLFLDDGGVMSDNEVRSRQWPRLVGEFFSDRLGRTPARWAQANREAFPRVFARFYGDGSDRRNSLRDPEALRRDYDIAWLQEMCACVPVEAPRGSTAAMLAREAYEFIMPRVQAALPGVVGAVRTLQARGYRINTASGGHSWELKYVLDGMELTDAFERLYGPDLVATQKNGPEFYARIFADAEVRPEEAIVVDESPAALAWAKEARAMTVLVGDAAADSVADVIVPDLSALTAYLAEPS
jgi:beta-phosphoglucomutase-like phosphatase (HAD superfamily)